MRRGLASWQAGPAGSGPFGLPTAGPGRSHAGEMDCESPEDEEKMKVAIPAQNATELRSRKLARGRGSGGAVTPAIAASAWRRAVTGLRAGAQRRLGRISYRSAEVRTAWAMRSRRQVEVTWISPAEA